VLRFAHELFRYYEKEHIILHKAYWSKKLTSDNAVVTKPDRIGGYTQELIERNNKLLAQYYGELTKALPHSPQIKIAHPIAYSHHKWGEEPFHYTDAYYLDFLGQLQKITST
jgi:hypothetical protein